MSAPEDKGAALLRLKTRPDQSHTDGSDALIAIVKHMARRAAEEDFKTLMAQRSKTPPKDKVIS
jgi:hypothetical protein